MTPEYIEELANIADPEKLWQLGFVECVNLTPEQRNKLNTGIALRRYAAHLMQLDDVRKAQRSLLITPLFGRGAAIKSIDTPPEHQRLRDLKADA